MIIVLADDFSGAAELAGIGVNHNLKTHVVSEIIPCNHVDLLVIDTSTRSLSEENAVTKISAICKKIKENFGEKVILFKKIDSVMRGHILAECKVIKDFFNFRSVCIAPANPGLKRKIIKAQYFVDNVLLHHSTFAHDPEFPVATSNIIALLKVELMAENFVHLYDITSIPENKIVTADIPNKEQLRNFIKAAHHDDLIAGASEAFELYIKKLGIHKSSSTRYITPNELVSLVVQGSTFDAAESIQRFLDAGFTLIPIDSEKLGVEGNKYLMEKTHEVLQWLSAGNSCVIWVVPNNNKHIVETILLAFTTIVQQIYSKLNFALHLIISGGSTASAIIHQLNLKQLEVVHVYAIGVVTLEAQSEKNILITVKPGSYPWPEKLIEKINHLPI